LFLSMGRTAQAEPFVRACRARGGIVESPPPRVVAPSRFVGPTAQARPSYPSYPVAPSRALAPAGTAAAPAPSGPPGSMQPDSAAAPVMPSQQQVDHDIDQQTTGSGGGIFSAMAAGGILRHVTFAALVDFSHAVSVKIGVPFDQRPPATSYASVLSEMMTDDKTGPVAELLAQPENRLDVLRRYVNDHWIDVYRSTPEYQGLLTAKTHQETADRTRESQVAQSLAADVRLAGSAVDLGVFGIQLGQPFKIPLCPAAPSSDNSFFGSDVMAMIGSHSAPAQTCIATGAFDGFLQGLMGPKALAIRGLASQVVYLSPDHCPNWVDSCTLYVSTMDGYSVATHFKTLSGQSRDVIDKNLIHKYGPKVGNAGDTVCRNNQTSIVTGQAYIREWNLSGLHVTYSPISTSFNCINGEVVVEMATYVKAQQSAAQTIEDAQPKM
jgi:hypothetical protein